MYRVFIGSQQANNECEIIKYQYIEKRKKTEKLIKKKRKSNMIPKINIRGAFILQLVNIIKLRFIVKHN